MNKKHFAIIMTLSILCAAFVYVTNTIQVEAVTQSGYENRIYFLKKTSTSDPKEYLEYSASLMTEIKGGKWNTEQIAEVVNAGYLAEYKDELIRLGYYVPPTQANTSQVNDKSDISAVFDAVYYYNKYPDLRTNIGNDKTALYNHFITVGMVEGRQGSEEFNLDVYKKNNPDLVKVFRNDNRAYYNHYITSGKAEKRIAK